MKIKHPFFIVLLLIITMHSSSFAQDNTQVGLPEGAIARLGKGGINIMRFSPDGTHLAVGTDVGVWLYDVPGGKETALFTGRTGQVNALAFSPDGKILATAGFANPVIQFWDIENGSKLSTLKSNDIYTEMGFNSVVALAFSADGTTLTSLDQFRTITHWDVNAREKLVDIGKVNSSKTVVFSRDSNTIAIGDGGGKIHLWNARTGSRQATLKRHTSAFKEDWQIRDLAFTKDGKIVASASEDKTVQLWNTDDYTKLATLEGHDAWVTAIAFAEDGKTLASGDAKKIIKLWDVNTRRTRATLIGHKNTINALTFSPDGETLSSGSADGTIRFWNANTGEEISTFTTGHTESVKSVAFSENDSILASAAFNGIVEVWGLKTKRELTTFTAAHADATVAVAFSSNANLFASYGSEGLIAFNSFGYGGHHRHGGRNNIQLWNLTTGEQIAELWQEEKNERGILTFSPDHNLLAVGNSKGIRVWDIKNAHEFLHFNSKWSFRKKLMFSPDGTKLATEGTDSIPEVWNLKTPHKPPILATEKAEVLAFSPDGTTLAIRNRKGIYLWQFDETKEKVYKKLLGNLQGLSTVFTFSPDGTMLVGAGMEHIKVLIKLWDVEVGNQLIPLTGHTESIQTLVFSHDGKTLASGAADGTVLLWDWEKIIAKAKENRGN